jgi:Ca2+-binding RTX toxin-like protein
MASRHWDDDRDHNDWHHDWHGDDDHDYHGGDDGFYFERPDIFRIDLGELNLKELGKITDYDISRKHLSVTLGNEWTFSVDGSGFDFVLKNNAKLPTVTGGTVDSFSIDGPGKADFSISGLDMSAKAFYNALTSFNVGKLLDLVLGGDETISGSGFGDYLYGAAGNDTILGNDGADSILGGTGADTLIGGANNDFLVGGNGSDSFVFGLKSGRDLITDFDVSADVIDLTAYGFDGSLEDLIGGCHGHGRHGGGWGEEDVVLDLGCGNMVKLEGVSRWDLTDANVLL